MSVGLLDFGDYFPRSVREMEIGRLERWEMREVRVCLKRQDELPVFVSNEVLERQPAVVGQANKYLGVSANAGEGSHGLARH